MGLAADPNIAVRGRIKIDEPSSSVSYSIYFVCVGYSFIQYEKIIKRKIIISEYERTQNFGCKIVGETSKSTES